MLVFIKEIVEIEVLRSIKFWQSRVTQLGFYFLYLLLPFLYSFLIDFLQIFMKSNLFLDSIIITLIILSKNNFNRVFKNILNRSFSLIRFFQSPDIQQLKCVLNSNFIPIRLTIHQKLRKMKQFLRLGCSFVHHTFFIHFLKFLKRYLFIKILIKFPYHSINLKTGDHHFHSFHNFCDLFITKTWFILWKYIKNIEKMFRLCRVYFELF